MYRRVHDLRHVIFVTRGLKRIRAYCVIHAHVTKKDGSVDIHHKIIRRRMLTSL